MSNTSPGDPCRNTVMAAASADGGLGTGVCLGFDEGVDIRDVFASRKPQDKKAGAEDANRGAGAVGPLSMELIWRHEVENRSILKVSPNWPPT